MYTVKHSCNRMWYWANISNEIFGYILPLRGKRNAYMNFLRMNYNPLVMTRRPLEIPFWITPVHSLIFHSCMGHPMIISALLQYILSYNRKTPCCSMYLISWFDSEYLSTFYTYQLYHIAVNISKLQQAIKISF